jgi:bacillithiol biosynthesis deacetylase BshB1
MSIDVLAFGPHPDDLEIGLGGVLAKHAARGSTVGLCDLTRGEMGSNGTVDERLAEAEEAAHVLGASWRVNLGLPDGGLRDDDEQVKEVVALIRRWQPRVVAAPYADDRHPDHRTASRLMTRAVFLGGLRRFASAAGQPWRPEWTCYYFINNSGPASFVVDVSEHYEIKRKALACHRSQFQAVDPGAVATRLTSPSFMRLIESRDAQFGAQIGVAFAEGLVVTEPVVRETLFR